MEVTGDYKMSEFEEHFITTFTGHKFHYLKPQDNEICIEDIAHALALTCRFGGHCKEFYSVAEHSVRVANIVEEQYKLKALLHDAHEAYLHDVVRPIKHDMPQYKIFADRIQGVINIKFLCSKNGDTEIKLADDTMLATEANVVMTTTEDWANLPEPGKPFTPMNWRNAERQFLKRFKMYTGRK